MTLYNDIKRAGNRMPYRTIRAAKVAGIPVWVACAFLEQETGGGVNVFGHDVNADGTPRPFWGYGDVTKEAYLAYKRERDLAVREPKRFPRLGRRMQGVGPMQLTWWEYQDRADKMAGCWDPYTNMLVGFQIIAAKRRAGKRWWQVAKEYNGKSSYADQMTGKFVKWERITGGR